jgi:opacity protein-like surface antigen
MPVSTFTSNFTSKVAFIAIVLGLSLPCLARAADNGPQGGSAPPTDRTNKPEEEDFSTTPYTEYGAFNQDKEEEEDTRFFQDGRFFGVSLGLGVETVDGNRGALYQGGFPTFDFKIHYWFDFNFALDIDFYYAKHYFNSVSTLYNGYWNVNILHLGVDLKYYFDTKNLSAAISFANPYLIVGGGSYTKTQSNTIGNTTTSESDSQLGFSGGAGLEFALKPKKVYFTAEAKIHIISFQDTNTNAFQQDGYSNLNGNFYTFIGSILFTW